MLSTLINKPHPFIFNTASALIPGITTAIIIIVFEPFGFDAIQTHQLIAIAAILGAIISASVWIFVTLMIRLLPLWMDPEKWTIGKETTLILLVLTGIILVIFMTIQILDLGNRSATDLLIMIIPKTFAISIFPILIMVLFEQYNHQKSQLKKALQLNKHISTDHQPDGTITELIQLHSENGKLAMQLKIQELIMLQSDGNYVDVFYLEQGIVKKELIRNRLKTLAESLPEGPFFQCHKRFIINGQYVIKVDGNARNFELTMRYFPQPIPVSRSKGQELADFLSSVR